jgi:hypothetical protein
MTEVLTAAGLSSSSVLLETSKTRQARVAASLFDDDRYKVGHFVMCTSDKSDGCPWRLGKIVEAARYSADVDDDGNNIGVVGLLWCEPEGNDPDLYTEKGVFRPAKNRYGMPNINTVDINAIGMWVKPSESEDAVRLLRSTCYPSVAVSQTD